MGSEISRLFVAIGAKTTEFEKGMDRVQGRLQKLQSVGKKLSLGLTLPIVAIGTAAFKMAGDFDQAFRKVNVMLKASAEEAEEYKKKIIDISNATGKSAADVADAFYQIVSAGFRGADAVDILTIAMQGAVGGAADAALTTAALTKAMNIFQLQGAEGAAQVMDTFFGIVDTGLLTFEELASSFPRAASNAAGLGISIEEVGAMFGTLTKVLGTTEQAATAVDATLRMLISPSEAMQELFEEWGVRSGPEAIEKFGGLTGVFEKLEEATGGEVTAIRELFASDEAMKGILPILTKNYKDYQKAIETVTNSQGRMNEALEEMTEGPGFQWQRMMNQMKNSMILLGDAIAKTLGPYIQKLIDWIQGVVEWFGNLDDKTQKVIITIGLLAAALGPTLLIGGALVNAIKGLIGTFKALRIIMISNKVAAAAMWGAITLGISLAVVGIIDLINHLNNVEQKWQEWQEEVAQLSQVMIDDVERVYDKMIGDAQAAANAEKTILEQRQRLWKDKHYEKMEILENEYIAELKAIDPILGAKIEGINNEIKAIKDVGEIRQEELDREVDEARIAELKKYLKRRDLTDLERRQAEDELADLEERWKIKALLEERNLLISEANLDEHYANQIEALQETTDAAIDEFEKQKDAFINSYDESLDYLENRWLPKYLDIMEQAGLKPSVTELPEPPEIPKADVSGKYTPPAELPIFPPFPNMQFGGIVKSPTLAMIGEGGPEAVIPLSNLNTVGKGDVHIHVGVLMGNEQDAWELGRMVRDVIHKQERI